MPSTPIKPSLNEPKRASDLVRPSSETVGENTKNALARAIAEAQAASAAAVEALESNSSPVAESPQCDHNGAATGVRAAAEGSPPVPSRTAPVAATQPEKSRPGDSSGLGCFSRARRRELWSRLRHWQPLILHPQRIYAALREFRKRPGGEEALGRFELLLDARGWHPTDQCALRRFVALGFGLDSSKPYNWGPRAKRSRRGLRGMAKLGTISGSNMWGWSMRGIGQLFLSRLFAAGDGEPVDRSTIREIYLDLASVGLCGFHQPPDRARLAPFERGNNGKGRPFNQYWFAMVSQLRKPSMRGELDDIASWTDVLDAWFARMHPSSPVPF